jgi:hypothetical protein
MLADTSVSWANNDAAGTAKTIDIGQIAAGGLEALGLITIYNPSSESDLTVEAQIKETMAGSARYGSLATFAVLKGTTRSVALQGIRFGEGIRFKLTNDTLIGAAGAFSAAVRVREG